MHMTFKFNFCHSISSELIEHEIMLLIAQTKLYALSTITLLLLVTVTSYTHFSAVTIVLKIALN